MSSTIVESDSSICVARFEKLDVADDQDSKSKFLGEMCANKAKSVKHLKQSTFLSNASSDEPCLMDQILAEALETSNRKKVEHAEKAKPFGKGLKKGFLSETNKVNSKKQSGQSKLAQKISSKNQLNKDVLEIFPKKKNEGIVLPEVQQAMKVPSVLASNDWVTQEFIDKIVSNPMLLAAMQDPQFTKALELMRDNPKAALNLFNGDPKAREIFLQLSSLLGTHFESLGAQETQETSKKFENKLRQEGFDTEVSRILADDTLRNLLMDPGMKNVLEQCKNPGKLRYFMNDSEYGPKIRKLRDAGLVQFQ